MEPLVSVIVPVYNVESYLQECLNSIKSQSYQNMEILLVDDGSTDQSVEICDAITKTDSRFVVIHQENSGPSVARNAALDICKGEYIVFVDSDDLIHVDYVKRMVDCQQKYNSDLVICGFIKFAGDYSWERCGEKDVISLYDEKEARLKFFYGKFPTYVHGKLYKASLFSSLRFPSGVLYEDVPVIWEILKNVRTICDIQMPLYLYRQRRGSIINTSYTHEKMAQVYFAEKIWNEVKDCDEQLNEGAKGYYFFCLCDLLAQIDDKHADDKHFLTEKIRKVRMDVLRNGRCSLKLRIMALLSGVSVQVVHLMGKQYKLYKWKKYENAGVYDRANRGTL